MQVKSRPYPFKSVGSTDLDREPRTISDVIYALLARYEVVFLIFLLFLFVAGALIAGRHKTLWFDEIFTTIVATQPNWHRFALAMPAEGNPPLNTLATRAFVYLFGLSEFSVRLAPLLGYLGALIGVFVFVRRECGPVYGLLGVFLMISQPAWKYSFEARPYGLMLGFLMLALVGWQSASRGTESSHSKSRLLAFAAMAAGIVGCVLSHNIGVVEVGVPLLFGEAVRTYQRRRVDWPLWTTALVVIPAMLVVIPMMRRTNQLIIVKSTNLVFPLTLHKVIAYARMSRISWPLVLDDQVLGFFVLVLFLTWAPRVFNRSQQSALLTHERIPLHIMAAATGALLLIPITWVAMMSAGGWYFCRYGIGSTVGIAILTCLLIKRRGLQQRTVVVLLMAFAAATFIISVRHYKPERPLNDAESQFIANNNSNLPIVISDPFIYPALWWYAPAAEKNKLVYLRGSLQGVGGGYPLVEAGLMAEKPFFAAPLDDLEPFLASHDHFLLESNAANPRLKDRLEKAGYKSSLIYTGERVSGYDMQRDRRLPSAR